MNEEDNGRDRTVKRPGILAGIREPEDLRKLDVASLQRLADEIRDEIIGTVSRCGGHLASSLGTVELTLALHYVFDTPTDKLIWDVGHQAYAHKLITGRKDRFHTLRTKGGLSGFPRRAESVYDVFGVGHSGTSISAASGLAEARCLQGEKYKIIAVIGDGSLTSGMSFEALNWVGDRKKDLIIVLNDNEMSISPNVGALSSYLNRVLTGHTVTKVRREIKGFLKSIPAIGEQVVKFTQQMEESLKNLVIPGAIFEELGFMYVGPLEGHRIDNLIKNLRNVKELHSPVLVHVITKKGKGYQFSEADPLRFHGIAPFDVDTGETVSANAAPQPPSYTKIFGRTVVKLARMDPRIVAVTAAMCEGTGLDAFAKEFPSRFYDVGIAEQHAVTFAAGLAVEGMIPVVAIYSTFLQRAYDQIIHDVCLQKLPIVLALDRAGFVGADGPTHHGAFDMSFLRAVPNLVIMVPKDENELQHMLRTAAFCGLPVAIRYPRGAGVGTALDETPRSLEMGRGEILLEGNDLAIFAVGPCVYAALSAAHRLRREGVSVRVVNARFVKPMDEELLCDTASAVRRVITVEENALMGGFGSAVLELFERAGLRDIAVKRLGILDEFAEHATQKEQRSIYGIDEGGILHAAGQLLGTSWAGNLGKSV
ncbi:MAG: 1-deoxy-D-xylulose-5-phosphate synthase [Syntrophales bacterium]|jgi:1-deoxy-D-xylulose-5-phosphate synthase|nr:1-deoxy-D-xylulose-5-phosphate synthase [Syntrophales bacterium]